MNIPFVDLTTQYRSLKPQKEFEESFASKYGVRHCISVGNGTDALYIVLKMLGIGPGDEVITVVYSWISTSEMITQTGAKPH